MSLKSKESVLRRVHTALRDGSSLEANLYLPAGDGPFPTIVERPPHYNERAFSPPLFTFLAENGFAVLAQDGYDTIEWTAAQTWCNGKGSAYGYSYASWTLWTLVPLRPPHPGRTPNPDRYFE
ncbi:MAG TPA: CocE/NonD family hydrolase [Spirochaetia bacterium]|nr:CocE/NonD family hydrolase [Spirochaetia bacterium]